MNRKSASDLGKRANSLTFILGQNHEPPYHAPTWRISVIWISPIGSTRNTKSDYSRTTNLPSNTSIWDRPVQGPVTTASSDDIKYGCRKETLTTGSASFVCSQRDDHPAITSQKLQRQRQWPRTTNPHGLDVGPAVPLLTLLASSATFCLLRFASRAHVYLVLFAFSYS